MPIGGAAHQSGQAGRVGALWVASPLGRSVIRVDLAIGGSRANEIELDQPPFDVAVGEGAVWVTQSAAVLRLEPQSGQIVETIPLDFFPLDIEVGGAAVWVADAAGDRILKIDPATNEVVATIDVGDEPRAISAGQGSLWVAKTRDETVARIDPFSGETLAFIEVVARPESLMVGESGVWVAVHPLGGTDEPLNEQEYIEALRRLDAWWSRRPFDYRDGPRGLIEDLKAVTPPPSWASDHALLVEPATVRAELAERLNDAVDAVDVDAAVEILPSGQGAITDIRKEMSYDFRLISSLHVTGTGSLYRCRDLGACDPASLLADYEDALNAGDMDSAIDLYAEDAAMIGHLFDDNGEADLEEIRIREDRESDADGTVTTFLNIQVDGDVVTFDQEFLAFNSRGDAARGVATR